MKKALVLVVLLAGCVSAEQRAERDLSRFKPYCEKIGFKEGTESFSNCIAQQAASRRAMGMGSERMRTNCVQVGNTMSCN